MTPDEPPSEAIAIAARNALAEYPDAGDNEENWPSISLIHQRGDRTEFDLGARYCRSTDPLQRSVGAQILGQLGWGAHHFHTESVDLLLTLLTDTEPGVISAAAFALGHRKSPRAIPAVLPLISHPDPDVRQGVVSALSCQEDPAALAGLIQLMADPDRDVRDWATFGVGSLSDTDSAEIRDALAKLIDEPDAEIRGEALIGLAKRQDPRVEEPLIRELSGEFHGSWCLEAAELLARPVLLPLLLDLRERIDTEDAKAFASDFARAIEACRSGSHTDR